MVAENKTIEQAIKEIDAALAVLTLPRREHIRLIENLKMITDFIQNHQDCIKVGNEPSEK